tara:strand:+ start:613 stop:819 length:207 start_codon:yes stop_codon:yes gene_type:complete
VQAGDLVKITRASLGVAYGRLGLIVKEYDPRAGARSLRSDQMIYVVKLVGSPSIPERRYLARDLKVIK